MNATQIIEQFTTKGYTPTQVVNATTRKLAHLQRHGGNAVEIGTWKKAVRDAKAMQAAAYSKQEFAGQIPCNPECMGAHEDECICPCGGINHGIHATAVGAGV